MLPGYFTALIHAGSTPDSPSALQSFLCQCTYMFIDYKAMMLQDAAYQDLEEDKENRTHIRRSIRLLGRRPVSTKFCTSHNATTSSCTCGVLVVVFSKKQSHVLC
eukprot:TRINITY_DN29641_c0_g1_i1.p1 TRINITY_DN29641_c0_g1~~TRINITY_DN29641_c0_g1_i1.p1  ORF type:complete len:105 (+),score=2.60 TRINITY_DN29641_c0_g1_i1:191-505(+)